MQTPVKVNKAKGIAMTEYLIILAVVAIAAITITALFGKQIKAVFSNSTAALQGTEGTATAGDTSGEAVAHSVPEGTKKGVVNP